MRERFKRMREGYFESISKKVVNDRKVSRCYYRLSTQIKLGNVIPSRSVCRNKTDETTRCTSTRARYLRTDRLLGSSHGYTS
jgi:hypothetical protein